MNSQPKSLLENLKWISIIWIFLGFILSVGLAFFAIHKAENHRIRVFSESTARIYRPKILEGDVRDVQAQARRALSLGADEEFVVRGKDFKVLYSHDGSEHSLSCKKIQEACFNILEGYIVYLQPIYYNDELKDSVFGYVELRVKSLYEVSDFVSIAGALLCIFFLIISGTTTAQKKLVRMVKKTSDSWSEHIEQSLTSQPVQKFTPFQEFASLDTSIQSLHSRIESLTKQTASDAKAKAQLSILRGIGHDLKTPFSQVRKFFEVFRMKAESNGFKDDISAGYVLRSFERQDRLLSQIGESRLQGSALDYVDAVEELKSYIEDLKKSGYSPKIAISFKSEVESAFIALSKVEFYRLIDNLVRNAMDAMETNGGVLSIEIENTRGIKLSVTDKGTGIPSDIIDKIFDADFTTKSTRGTGLGLANVKKICADSGSSINVFSEVGTGTRFEISFKDLSSAHASEVRELSL